MDNKWIVEDEFPMVWRLLAAVIALSAVLVLHSLSTGLVNGGFSRSAESLGLDGTGQVILPCLVAAAGIELIWFAWCTLKANRILIWGSTSLVLFTREIAAGEQLTPSSPGLAWFGLVLVFVMLVGLPFVAVYLSEAKLRIRWSRNVEGNAGAPH